MSINQEWLQDKTNCNEISKYSQKKINQEWLQGKTNSNAISKYRASSPAPPTTTAGNRAPSLDKLI
jgi:hypothetical protein